MKTAGPSLLFLVAAGTLAAAVPATASATSARLNAEIRASLPAYSPPPPPPPESPAAAAAPDPDVLVLPTLTVRKRIPPRIGPNDLMTPRALNKKFAADYKRSLKGLDAWLNGFSIPLFGPSLAARGRARYTAQQFRDLSYVINAPGMDDPDVSVGLQQAETGMKQAIGWQNRPAGGK